MDDDVISAVRTLGDLRRSSKIKGYTDVGSYEGLQGTEMTSRPDADH